MIINNLSALKINKLTKEQYDRLLEDGLVKEDELYLIPDSVNAIPAPEAAKVGQVLSVASIDENGKPESWETVGISSQWRYLGRLEASEELAAMEMINDQNGYPFVLKKVIIQGSIAPNSAGNTGWVRPYLNGFSWPSTVVTGMAEGENVVGRAFRFEFEVIGTKLMMKPAMVSLNTTSVPTSLVASIQTPPMYTDTIDNANTITSISRIKMQGYQTPIFGVGSWFEVWGVDA